MRSRRPSIARASSGRYDMNLALEGGAERSSSLESIIRREDDHAENWSAEVGNPFSEGGLSIDPAHPGRDDDASCRRNPHRQAEGGRPRGRQTRRGQSVHGVPGCRQKDCRWSRRHLARRQNWFLSGIRRTRSRSQETDADRLDLPHLFDEQGHYHRCRAQPLRRRKDWLGRPCFQVYPELRQPQGRFARRPAPP